MKNVDVKRTGLVIVTIVMVLVACMPPPPPSERLFKFLGQEELADPVFHRSMHAGDQVYNQGYYAAAENYYSVGFKRAKEIGFDPFIAAAVGYLFDAYVAHGKYGEAEQLFRESLTIIEGAHPHRADYLKKYAALLRSMGREVEAAEIETRTKAITKSSPEGE